MRLLLVVVAALAIQQSSQRPTPTPAKPAYKPQQISRHETKDAQSDRDETNQATPSEHLRDAPPCCRTAVNGSNQQNNKSRSDSWITVFTGVLAAVAVLQLIAMVLQYIAMYRQADYMRRGLRIAIRSARSAQRAASAALLNARAVINAERPWMLIQINTNESATDENGIHLHLGFSVSFRNYGKTPSEIVAFENDINALRDISDLPSPPEYKIEGMGMTHTRIVPPGELWRDPGQSSFYAESSGLLHSQWEEVLKNRLRLVYWGRLQYRDLIEQPQTIHELENIGTIHQTCFCYFWSPSGNEFLAWGPLGYNKHT
jgi:hypothetical protein